MRGLLLTSVAAVLAVLGLTAAGADVHAAGPGTGTGPGAGPASVTVVQAVPGASLDVTIDGRSVAEAAQVGDVLGPFDLEPGEHEVTFSGSDVAVDSTLTVGSGESSDVVVHLPAEVGGDPVVHSYAAPTGAIGPGKARVLLAHTATVAPADVEVDGQTVFTNIANGEFADADVPEGTIEVALLPSGTEGDPILGPLDVSLEARTLSMIYAYGNPRDGSMSAIAHTVPLSADGSVQPSRIDTGSAGLVEQAVSPFGAADGDAGRLPLTLLGALGMLVATGAGAHGVRRRLRHAPQR